MSVRFGTNDLEKCLVFDIGSKHHILEVQAVSKPLHSSEIIDISCFRPLDDYRPLCVEQDADGSFMVVAPKKIDDIVACVLLDKGYAS